MRLKEYLKKEGISQIEFAAKMGYDPTFINQAVNGRKRFSAASIKKIIAMTGSDVSVEELLFPEDFEPSKNQPRQKVKEDLKAESS